MPPSPDDVLVFCLDRDDELGTGVAAHLGIPLAPYEARSFEDGEHKIRPLVSVRGCHVFVLSSLCGDASLGVNDRLVRLLFFIGCLRDASAATVTAIVPYLAYARKDRKTKTRDPVTTRYVATLFEAVGVDRVVTVDVHNLAAFQNAFRCRTDHLEALPLFVRHFATLARGAEVAVVAPDQGGVKRAHAFRTALEHEGLPCTPVFVEKLRSGGVVSGDAIVGRVEGRAAIIVDDMIVTGTTLTRGAEACRRAGAASVHAVATHGMFQGDAVSRLSSVFESVVVTNSIGQSAAAADRGGPASRTGALTVIDLAPLLASAIARIHTGGSLVELLDPALTRTAGPATP
jgi:ribose-phosphate pyrophosphokinase